MSLEAAIAKLTAAVEEQNALLRNGATQTATQPEADKAEAKDSGKPADSGPGYWKTADDSMVGKFVNEKEFEAIQNQHDTELVKITHEEAKKLSAALKKAKAKKEKAAEEKAAKTEAKKEKVEESAAEEEHPSEEDLIKAFTKYLPKDLPKEQRAERAPAIKDFLSEQGAKKATDLKPEQRAEAIAFVEKLLADLETEDEDDDLV